MYPLLFAMGLCAFSYAANGHAMQMSDPIPKEEKVLIQYLSNGVKTYVQEHARHADAGSLKIVLRKASRSDALYSFEGKMSDKDQIALFFEYCKQRVADDSAIDGIPFNDNLNLPASGMNFPKEMAVVAVGDFSKEEMFDLIEKHFASITLSCKASRPIQIDSDASIHKVALCVSFPNLPKSIRTYADLKECWKFLMLQELYQMRLERCSRNLNESWVHPHPRFFYPVCGYMFASHEASESLLSFVLWQIETMRNEGFYEDEFHLTKCNLLNQLQFLSSNAPLPDSTFLASYYADQFLLGDNCLSYESFLDASAQLIEEIGLKDLAPNIEAFLAEDNRIIRLIYPALMQAHGMTEPQIQKVIDRIATLAAFYRNSEISNEAVKILDSKSDLASASESTRPIEHHRVSPEQSTSIQLANIIEPAQLPFAQQASIITVADATGSIEPFYQLPLNEKERRIIRSIFTTMAEKNIFELALVKRSMEKKGKKVTHVHPMRFVGYIFSNHQLRGCMKKIVKSSFKWDAFVDGFSKRMKEEHANNNLHRHIPGFCQEVGADPHAVARFIDKKDWEGLVKSLL